MRRAVDSDIDRLKTLFWISASNFVFPVVFDLALLITAFRNASFLEGAYVLMVSNYVDIVGVLLATIWSTSTKYPHAQPMFTISRPMDGLHTARGRNSSRFAVATIAESPTDERDGISIPVTVFSSSVTGTTPSGTRVSAHPPPLLDATSRELDYFFTGHRTVLS